MISIRNCRMSSRRFSQGMESVNFDPHHVIDLNDVPHWEIGAGHEHYQNSAGDLQLTCEYSLCFVPERDAFEKHLQRKIENPCAEDFQKTVFLIGESAFGLRFRRFNLQIMAQKPIFPDRSDNSLELAQIIERMPFVGAMTLTFLDWVEAFGRQYPGHVR
jgi:hypothetical protein